jgi:hypothetical protein
MMLPIHDRRWFSSRLAIFVLGVPFLCSCETHRGSGITRIGFTNGSEPEMNQAFFDELTRLGHVQGKTFAVETRLLTGVQREFKLYDEQPPPAP